MSWFRSRATKQYEKLFAEFSSIADARAPKHSEPPRELYDFLMEVWCAYMKAHGYAKMGMPHIAPLFVKYGAICEKPSMGVYIIANMAAVRLVPDFEPSEAGIKFEPILGQIMHTIEADQGESFNGAFRARNPTGYEQCVAILGHPPFITLKAQAAELAEFGIEHVPRNRRT
jgi:hypothetical protein